MTERIQRLLWTMLAAIAVTLAATTVYLYSRSRTLSAATQKPAGRIAYVSFSEASGIPQIYTCDLQGGDVRPLVESRSGDVLPVSGPLRTEEGRSPRIAFVRFTSDPDGATDTLIGATGGVYVAGGNGQERKVSGSVPRFLPVAPAWSPDGEQLAFAGVEDLDGDGKYVSAEAGIYIGDAAGREVKRVAAVHATGLRLNWSPLGPGLILQVQRTDAPVPVAHLLNLQTGELSARDEATTVGCWSPKGQYIAAYSMADREIHVLSADGDELWATETPEGYVTDLLWLPAATTAAEDEGRFLALCADEPNSSWGRLFVSSNLIARGDAPTWRQLTGEDASAAYLAASPDGGWALFTLLPGHGSEMDAAVYLLNLERGQLQQLTQEPGFEGMATWVQAR